MKITSLSFASVAGRQLGNIAPTIGSSLMLRTQVDNRNRTLDFALQARTSYPILKSSPDPTLANWGGFGFSCDPVLTEKRRRFWENELKTGSISEIIKQAHVSQAAIMHKHDLERMEVKFEKGTWKVCLSSTADNAKATLRDVTVERTFMEFIGEELVNNQDYYWHSKRKTRLSQSPTSTRNIHFVGRENLRPIPDPNIPQKSVFYSDPKRGLPHPWRDLEELIKINEADRTKWYRSLVSSTEVLLGQLPIWMKVAQKLEADFAASWITQGMT